MRRMAGHCVTANPGLQVCSSQEMFDAALDGMVQYLHDQGWTSDLDVARAGGNGVAALNREAVKHMRNRYRWPHAEGDFSEELIDLLAARQLVQVFTSDEWRALLAFVKVLEAGGCQKDAADALGLPLHGFEAHLSAARKKARKLWIAPGETPRGVYKPGVTKMSNRKKRDAKKARKMAA